MKAILIGMGAALAVTIAAIWTCRRVGRKQGEQMAARLRRQVKSQVRD